MNASRIPGAHPTPTIWSARHDAIVTTDLFAFDDSTNHYKLQGLGRAHDMGDAMVGNAMQAFPHVASYAIRTASDPQIPDPSGDIRSAAQQGGRIYSKYGVLTTAASVIATWAVIHTATSGSHRSH